MCKIRLDYLNNNRNEKNEIILYATGILFGIVVGLFFGIIFDKIGLGIAFGLPIGVGIGFALKNKYKMKNE